MDQLVPALVVGGCPTYVDRAVALPVSCRGQPVPALVVGVCLAPIDRAVGVAVSCRGQPVPALVVGVCPARIDRAVGAVIMFSQQTVSIGVVGVMYPIRSSSRLVWWSPLALLATNEIAVLIAHAQVIMLIAVPIGHAGCPRRQKRVPPVPTPCVEIWLP